MKKYEFTEIEFINLMPDELMELVNECEKRDHACSKDNFFYSALSFFGVLLSFVLFLLVMIFLPLPIDLVYNLLAIFVLLLALFIIYQGYILSWIFSLKFSRWKKKHLSNNKAFYGMSGDEIYTWYYNMTDFASIKEIKDGEEIKKEVYKVKGELLKVKLKFYDQHGDLTVYREDFAIKEVVFSNVILIPQYDLRTEVMRIPEIRTSEVQNGVNMQKKV